MLGQLQVNSLCADFDFSEISALNVLLSDFFRELWIFLQRWFIETNRLCSLIQVTLVLW